MPLPGTVRVKLSSEAAEYVSLTPVVVRDMPVRELVEQMLGITGKSEARVRELLLRGTLVSGASRYRWTGWEADRDAIASLLAGFPDPMPGRSFSPAHCVRISLHGGKVPIEISRESGSRKPLFHRTSFWDRMMELAGTAGPRYLDYSYRERADVYQARISAEMATQVRSASGALKYSVLREQIRASALDAADLYVVRP